MGDEEKKEEKKEDGKEEAKEEGKEEKKDEAGDDGDKSTNKEDMVKSEEKKEEKKDEKKESKEGNEGDEAPAALMQKSSDSDENGNVVTSTFDLDMKDESEKIEKKPEAPVKKVVEKPKEEEVPEVDILALANKISNVGLIDNTPSGAPRETNY